MYSKEVYLDSKSSKEFSRNKAPRRDEKYREIREKYGIYLIVYVIELNSTVEKNQIVMFHPQFSWLKQICYFDSLAFDVQYTVSEEKKKTLIYETLRE